MSEAPDPAVVAALPGYDVGNMLGQGGYGVVRLGHHRRLGRAVAIKQIPTALARDPGVRARFVEEARALASFDHPHIVHLYDYVEQDDLCLLVMEYLPGGSVADETSRHGMSGETACATAMVTCAALHYAHAHHVLHRDIKPENVLYTAQHALKVADFGIAKVVGGGDVLTTSAGELLGTPAYMAPEQASGGELGPAADVYSTGLMLYELMSGRLPYREDGGGLAIIYRHVYQEPTHLREVAPHVPADVADVVMRSIARELPDRFADAQSFGVALGEAAVRSYGAGWLSRAEVRLLSPGPILDSALTSHTAGPRPSTPSARVRRASTSAPQAGRARESAISAGDLVPVRDAPRLQQRRTRAFAAAGALAMMGVLAAASVPRSLSETAPLPAGSLVLAGQDLSAAGSVTLDLSQPVPVSVDTSASPLVGAAEVTLSIEAAGVQLGTDPRAQLENGSASLASASVAALTGGPVAARLTVTDEQSATLWTQWFRLQPSSSQRLLVPGVVTGGLAMLVGAYAESLLRPVRRRRRCSPGTLLGMGLVGAGAGAACVLAVWLLGLQPLGRGAGLLVGLLGAGAAVALTIATATPPLHASSAASSRTTGRRARAGAPPVS